MEAAWSEMKVNISLSNKINTNDAEVSTFHEKLRAAMHTAVTRCRKERKRKSAGAPAMEVTDEMLCLAARHTDRLPLANYDGILHLAPRLVNVVTLAEAIPVPGSGVTLPLDLQAIAARCTNAYYAPKRFAAVQLAFSNSRCRVLIFHTGRLVGTGCSGPMAARLAILKAARQLAVEANVHVTIRNFSVINQVGAVSIDAKLNCDAFASTHSATSHYDRASFVGLAWRPGGEAVCCEIYSTGKANLPGSTRERDLLTSFSRMVSELLRHSDRPEVCKLLPEHLQQCHRPRDVARDDAPVLARSKVPMPVRDLFADEGDEWALAPLGPVGAADLDDEDAEDLLEVNGF